MKALWINSEKQEITVVDYAGLTDLQRMVGGYIEVGMSWPNGDVLFVDEEGLLKPKAHWFMIEGNRQPLGGNGIVVGREDYDKATDKETQLDVATTVEQLTPQVRFLTRDQAVAWGRANASDVSMSITTLSRDGTTHTEPLAHYREIFDNLPDPDQKTED